MKKKFHCLKKKIKYYYLFKIILIFNGTRWFPIFIERVFSTFNERDFILYLQSGRRSKKDMEGCKITSNIHAFKIKNNKSLIKLTSK